MSSSASPLQAVFALLRLLLIGALALGALLFGTLVAVTIFVGVSIARLFRGNTTDAAPPVTGNGNERVFDAEYEVVRRPGSGVLTPIERDRNGA